MATSHVQEVATFRAGGLPAIVRTIAHCGLAGTVAYSLTGTALRPNLATVQSIQRSNAKEKTNALLLWLWLNVRGRVRLGVGTTPSRHSLKVCSLSTQLCSSNIIRLVGLITHQEDDAWLCQQM